MSSLLATLRTHNRWVLIAFALVALKLVWDARRARQGGNRTGGGSNEHPLVEMQPGQEGAIEPLLGRGASLPGGCRYVEARFEPTHITAHYACPDSQQPFTLDLYVGPVGAPISGYTKRFGVVSSAGFPASLRAAILARITPREDHFLWQIQGQHVERAPSR